MKKQKPKIYISLMGMECYYISGFDNLLRLSLSKYNATRYFHVGEYIQYNDIAELIEQNCYDVIIRKKDV